MSLNGLNQFRKNLDTVFESKEFKKLNEKQQLIFLFRLLNSEYGLNTFGVGVKSLKDKIRNKIRNKK